MFMVNQIVFNCLFFSSLPPAEEFFLNDPDLQDEVPSVYLSHKELYEYAIRKATIIFTKIRKLQEDGKDGVDNYMYELHFGHSNQKVN